MCQPAIGADWETKDSWLLGGALGLLAVDWAQTRKITNDEPLCAFQNGVPVDCVKFHDHRETNHFLGPHPSNPAITRYFLITMAGTAGISYALPAKYRRYFLGGVLIIESAAVIHNHRIGLRWGF